MANFFHTFFYTPIYNLLVFFAVYVPGGDIGIAIILVTIVVKIVLLPLSLGAVRTQKAMKKVEPHLKKIKEDHKDDKEKQAKEMMALYKEHGISPFSSFLSIFIQLPVIFALYWVFRGQSLPNIDPSLMYSFIHIAGVHTTTLFLGVLDITQKNIFLAIFTGLLQMAQGFYTIPLPEKSTSGTPSSANDFNRAMTIQMRFVLPVIIGLVAYTSGGIALYFMTSTIVAIAQEYFIRKTTH
jgi:YidC/Oxa1 family membrane protein insertase